MSLLFTIRKEKLPTEWKLLKIGNLLSATQYGTNTHNDTSGQLKVVGMKDIQKGKILTKKLTTTKLSKNEKDKFLLKKGDILINRTNSYELVGKVGLYNSDIEAIFASYLVRLIIKKDLINPFFLNYWLNSYKAQIIIKKIATRAISQANINPTEFKKFSEVPVPPLPEQKAIASLLSVWDEAIEKTERLIEVKEKRLKWLSNKLLFGRNFTLTNDVKTKWFNIPKHWELKTIKDIANEVKITNGTSNNIPVFSCTKYDGLVDSLKYFDKKIYSDDTSNYKVVKKGQFAYATNHIEEGSIGYQNLYSVGLVSPMYTVFKTNSSIDDGYFYKLLKTETFRHMFEVNTSASVNRRGSLRWNQFSKLPIPFPPIDEQIKINKILNIAREEIAVLNKLLKAYKIQKRGLMQKLLTGKWRVK